MKYLVVFACIILAGCHKNKAVPASDFSGAMTVIKDCTGDYLRYNKKDYIICNKALLAGYNSLDEVTASIRKTTCSDNRDGTCYMMHVNEGWAEVLSIQKK
ncbi:hypothetical protein [Niabella beijingensis]|uniref:hypothetical protein n=1 Tax=Niabella beijingensis TaxID=2872700 RepID=UPI001CC043AD|nr:hypothetical protein [Niabella beijingensis]MBZ4190651.1 hypothetical protein [Niabella beijingensis]